MQAFQQLGMNRPTGAGQRVKAPKALFAGPDQAGPAEVSEVPGGTGLGDSQDGYQITDAQFPVKEQVQDAQAGAVGEGPE
jgi:hypothetical protein